MIIYKHVINDLRSVTKIWFYHWILENSFRQERTEGETGAYYLKANSLAFRRGIFKKVFKKGKEARSKSKEKKFLKQRRNTYMITLVRRDEDGKR